MESEGEGCGGGEPHHYLSMASTKNLLRCQGKPNTARETHMKANSGDPKLAYMIEGDEWLRSLRCKLMQLERLSLDKFGNKCQNVSPHAIGSAHNL